MKIPAGAIILFICFIIAGLAGSVAIDAARYDKSVTVSLTIDKGTVLIKSTDIHYGSAPNHFPLQGDFRGELVAADGTVQKAFPVWDPRIQFGDTITGSPGDLSVEGMVDRQETADTVVIFPFYREVTGFRLYDVRDGTLLASVDLKPQIDRFFASYPDDPDNPASVQPTAVSATSPGPAGVSDPLAGQSRQLWGILGIGSGALLLLGGTLASVRLMQKKPKSILIVDDDPDIVDVIAGMLRLGGYAPRTATSGGECLKLLEAAIPDLVLLDIGMAPMDGWETLRRIKKNPATRGIMVIMLTAQKLMPDDVENYAICIDDYIIKPVTIQHLNDAITHVFARKQMIEEKIAALRKATVDRDELCECARLTRVVDVNKRLWDTLIKTYDLDAAYKQGAGSEIPPAIKHIEGKFRDQEHWLEQIRRNIGSRTTE